MIRIFLPQEQLRSDNISITGDKARYLSIVLRSKPGDTITVLDGNGFKYECAVTEVHKKEVSAKLIKKIPYSVESPLSITLAQGIAKGDKMDFIIQKSTELGVGKITPLITERSQVRHTAKIQRWRKIALSASRQSGRYKIPEIDEPVGLREFLSGQSPHMENAGDGGYCGIIFSEEHEKRNLKKVLSSLKNTGNITLLIGPEGGFSKEETADAVKTGFIPASLGPRILRTETAPVAAISIIQYELGDAG